jgi:hypothetical protein
MSEGEDFKTWLASNQTLVMFLAGQMFAFCIAGASILSYAVKLESRVNTLEVRGSPHLTLIDNRLTVLESMTRENKDRLDRIIEIMTRELNQRPK